MNFTKLTGKLSKIFKRNAAKFRISVLPRKTESGNLEIMNLKQLAGEKAVEFIKEGMNIGLGTGSTIYWTMRRLGAMIAKDGLQVRAVPTSRKTEKICDEFGIPTLTFADVQSLDLTIDGADEISPALDLIKGGGGALLREKLVAAASKRLLIVADETKMVSSIGAFPVPVEVVTFGWETTARRIENLNLNPTLRVSGERPFLTDNGNYILDCVGEKIENANEMHQNLKLLTGVVETGYFIGMANTAIIAGETGIKMIERNSRKK